jgi:hypothetical protein
LAVVVVVSIVILALVVAQEVVAALKRLAHLALLDRGMLAVTAVHQRAVVEAEALEALEEMVQTLVVVEHQVTAVLVISG